MIFIIEDRSFDRFTRYNYFLQWIHLRLSSPSSSLLTSCGDGIFTTLPLDEEAIIPMGINSSSFTAETEWDWRWWEKETLKMRWEGWMKEGERIPIIEIPSTTRPCNSSSINLYCEWGKTLWKKERLSIIVYNMTYFRIDGCSECTLGMNS